LAERFSLSANLECFLLDTFRGVSRRYLSEYIAEFIYRFNRWHRGRYSLSFSRYFLSFPLVSETKTKGTGALAADFIHPVVVSHHLGPAIYDA
jgi:hypothetical protein